jgi:pimeloyl-ACP methyl ester carboxylesterase
MLTRIVAFATAAVLAAHPIRPAPAPPRGRPVILLVHGRGLLDRDTSGLRRLWQQAIESGGRTLTRAPLLDDGDVRLVWYADVLDPTSSAGCDFAARERRPDAADVADLRNFASAVGGVISLISSLIDDRDQNVGLRSIVGDLEFITDSRKRCAVDGRVTSALETAHREGRPVILVAHSLGSVITYDALSTAKDAPPVERLVTVGAVVGAPVLRQFLLGGPGDDTLRIPSSVKSWVNVRRPGDPFAAALSSSIIAPREGRSVRDLLTDSPDPMDAGEAHDVIGYLRDVATARAILSAWCGAFAEKPPTACKDIQEGQSR